jgi:predicted outer membrane repeat protein
VNTKHVVRYIALTGVALLLLLALTLAVFAAPAAAVRYVIPGGATSGACASWATACALPYALTVAVSGDELWVKAGTYKPTTGLDRHATFQLKNGVGVYGGFSGTETLRDQRSWGGNSTVLSGDIGTIGNNGDNVYHVVTADNVNAATVLDGFRITGGNANDNSSACPGEMCGGGLHVSYGDPTISHLVVFENAAIYGGGVSIYDGAPALTTILFSDNTADTYGGGVYIDNASGPTLTDMRFLGNSAHHGGGLYIYFSTASLINSMFISNAAVSDGGGMTSVSSQPALTQVLFTQNTAGGYGGGLSQSWSYPLLTNVTFDANVVTDGNGGALYNDFSGPHLHNVTFSNNSVTGGNGGALYNDLNSTPVLTNVTFYSNTAIMSPGFSGGHGGAIFDYSTPVYTLTNVTFSNNRALGYDAGHPAYGGALYSSGGSAALRNAILWANTPEQIYNETTATAVNTGIVQGGCPTGSTCTGVSTTDPRLGAFDIYGGFVNTIPLLPGSSAIDTANDTVCPAVDARSVTRPKGPHCDIGAFESYGFTLSIAGGNDQSTPITTAFPQSLKVSVIANSPLEPVNGGKITFTPPASGASASLATSPATVISDTASVNATANGTRGTYIVTATLVDANSIGFTLHNTAVLYVKPGASGNCNSWATACELQTALAQAVYGDEIWVAAGMYKPTTGSDRNATFQLVNGVSVYGGFAGTETTRNQRNWTTNVTTLSGDIGAIGTASDNSYRVVTANSATLNTALNGFTITGAQGTGQVGGGVYINNGSLTIANCRITVNSADYGGGVFQSGDSGRVDVIDSRVELNTASNHGGGLYITGQAALTSTQILSNTASGHGGGVHMQTGDVSVFNGLIYNNRATQNGGGLNANNAISLNGTRFISNTAGQYGGGLLQWNGGYTVTLIGAVFERNQAGQEGSALWAHGNVQATNLVVINNTALRQGSVMLKGSTSHFSHATFSRNTGGPGLILTNEGVLNSTLLMTNTIFVSHTTGISATAGSIATLNGVLWQGNGANTGGSVTVQNATTGDPAFATDGYHLTRSSLAIDHGVNAGILIDIDGDPRPMGSGYDLGADEFRFKVYLPLIKK